MKHSEAAGVLRRVAPPAALLLTALRVVTWLTAFDENGLLPRGSTILTVTVLAAACCFGGLCFLCLKLNRLPGTEACFPGSPLVRILRLAAAALLLLGSLPALKDADPEAGWFERAVLLCGAVSALLLCALTLAPTRGPWAFWARLLPALYTGAALVLRFRVWSYDPMVIHVLPLLLAWTCCMVEMTLLSGFSLGAGSRRSSVLFGLGAGVFTCMALPDFLLGPNGSLTELLPLLGLALWCAVSACELLGDRVQNEAPAAEASGDAAPVCGDLCRDGTLPSAPPQAEEPDTPANDPYN